MGEKEFEKELLKLKKLSDRKLELYTNLFDEFILLVRSSGVSRALNALLACAPPPILLRHIESVTGKKIEELLKDPEDEKVSLLLFSFWSEIRQNDPRSKEKE